MPKYFLLLYCSCISVGMSPIHHNRALDFLHLLCWSTSRLVILTLAHMPVQSSWAFLATKGNTYLDVTFCMCLQAAAGHGVPFRPSRFLHPTCFTSTLEYIQKRDTRPLQNFKHSRATSSQESCDKCILHTTGLFGRFSWGYFKGSYKSRNSM